MKVKLIGALMVVFALTTICLGSILISQHFHPHPKIIKHVELEAPLPPTLPPEKVVSPDNQELIALSNMVAQLRSDNNQLITELERVRAVQKTPPKSIEKSLNSQIQGKWNPIRASPNTVIIGPHPWEFFADGTVTGSQEFVAMTGNYRVIDANHIRIDWPPSEGVNGRYQVVQSPGISEVYQVSFTNGTAILSKSSGLTITFKR